MGAALPRHAERDTVKVGAANTGRAIHTRTGLTFTAACCWPPNLGFGEALVSAFVANLDVAINPY
jgi:hypothetical protein